MMSTNVGETYSRDWQQFIFRPTLPNQNSEHSVKSFTGNIRSLDDYRFKEMRRVQVQLIS